MFRSIWSNAGALVNRPKPSLDAEIPVGAFYSRIFLFVVHWIDEFRIDKDAEAFQQKIQLEQAQSARADIKDIKKFLLENRGKNEPTPDLSKFIETKGFEQKYPLGFALFYSDGSKTLHYGIQPNPDISFDLASIHVLSLTHDEINMSGFAITVKGSTIIIDKWSIGIDATTAHSLIGINGIDVVAESLGGSTEGAAWIIGVRPA